MPKATLSPRNAVYRYAGSDAGVPGLPHEITAEQAKELGVEELLKAAIGNGSYIVVAESATEELNHG